MEIITSGRLSGKFNKHIIDIADKLKLDKSVGIIGLKCPNKHLTELEKLNVFAITEPMFKQSTNKFIYDMFGEPIDILYESIQTGYIFSIIK